MDVDADEQMKKAVTMSQQAGGIRLLKNAVKDELKQMITKHYEATGSQAAKDILNIFDQRVSQLLDGVDISSQELRGSEMTLKKALSVLISQISPQKESENKADNPQTGDSDQVTSSRNNSN